MPAGREADYDAWLDEPYLADLARLLGFVTADRFELTAEQVMPDIAQRWHYMSVYGFDIVTPGIDLPALGPLLAGARCGQMFDETKTSAPWPVEAAIAAARGAFEDSDWAINHDLRFKLVQKLYNLFDANRTRLSDLARDEAGAAIGAVGRAHVDMANDGKRIIRTLRL